MKAAKTIIARFLGTQCARLLLFAVFWLCFASSRVLAVGTWVPLVNQAPSGISTMLLLSDGRVMATDGGRNWYSLTPDNSGSYLNGTWAELSSMHDSRYANSSQVLTDGGIFEAGGEYGTGGYSAEVYNPVFDTWTMCPGNGALFSDSLSEIISNGNVLITPVGPTNGGGTVVYNPNANSWTVGPQLFRGYYEDEASCVKLPDNSILVIDSVGSGGTGTNSERYIPSLNEWINDANVPVNVYGGIFEMGAALLLPNGNAFFLGAGGTNAIYIPSASTNIGTWVAGPVTPNGQCSSDTPAAMMVNGKELCMVSPYPTSGPPSSFYEYDSVANAFTLTSNPGNTTYYTQGCRLLDLPDGSILFTSGGSQLYEYQPDGSPLAEGQPVILSISTNYYRSYHLTGLLLNGISEGSGYGDDAQMNSNYPLVRMTNTATGVVYYVRTYNWSSTGVMTGTNIISTEFIVPDDLPAGTYSLVVVANGNASAPVPFTFTPDTLDITLLNGFVSSGQIGGPFNPNEQAYFLNNKGASSLNWALSSTSLWLNASSTGGTLQAGAQSTVFISINSSATNLPARIYTTTVWFTNFSDGAVQSVPFELEINPLLQNGGFELGGFAGWEFSGNQGSSRIVGNYNGIGGAPNSSHSGLFSAFLQMNDSPGFLSQTINTVPGQSYLLSLFLNSPSGAGSSNEFAVLWDGETLFDEQDITTSGWTNLQFVVQATGTSTPLDFEFVNLTNYFSLDDVTLTNLPASLSIASQPANQTIPQGASTFFSVLASGPIPYAYQWQKSGTNLINGGDISGSTTAQLLVNNAAIADSGNYTVVVSNDFQSVTSVVATLTVFPTNDPGFIVYPWHTTMSEPNDVAVWTEEQILGLMGPSYAALTNWPNSQNGQTENAIFGPQGLYYIYTNYINWDIEGLTDSAGDFTSSNGVAGYPKQEFPGMIIGTYPDESGFAATDGNNFSMLVETWLYFPIAGTWQMGVNSDDGFSVRSGQAPGDIFGQLLGEYEGGRGSSDSTFYFSVPEPGLYPFRLLYEQGGGGANCEWFTVTQAGQRVLINDSSQGANAIYSYVQSPNWPIYVSGVIPVNGATGVGLNENITAFLVDGNAAQVASVQMWINGSPEAVSTSRNGNVTTATVSNPGNSSLLLPLASNTVTIVYSDYGLSPHSYTNSWEFATSTGYGISANCAVSPPERLVSWWTANVNANDEMGLNNGTLENGANFAPGEVGYAFDLNGSGEYVSVPSTSSLEITNTITIVAWVNSAEPAIQQGILEKYGPSAGGYALRIASTGQLQFYTLDNGNTFDAVTGSTVLNANTWYLVAGLWNGTNLQVYLNGNLDGTIASLRNPKFGTTPVRIGARGDDASFSFSGLVDEIQIYNRALTSSEIQAIYQAGTNGMCAPTPFMFSSPPVYSKTNGVVLNARLRSDQAYQIEAITNLEGTNWITLTNFTAGTAPIFYYTNKATTNIPQQFYRIVSP